MPTDLRKLLRLIRKAGFTVTITKNGHYLVLNEDGKQVSGFAISHGARSKRGEVLDVYVRKVMTAIHQAQGQDDE